MERLSLEAELRKETGKGHARRMRREGYVPAVLYGKERESVPLKISEKVLSGSLRSNAIIDLTIKSGRKKDKAVVMIKDLQKDVIKGHLIHADFHEISLEEKMIASVSLHLIGEPAGVKEGGILSQALREVDVECLPTDIPSWLEVDISHLEVGDSLNVSEIETPEGVTIVTEGDETVVSVVLPTIEEEPEEVEEEEDLDQEPAVIGEEEDEEEAAEEAGETREEE